MIIKTSSIDWDTDDDWDVFDSLPQEVTLEVESEEDVADALSDSFGWCVLGLTLEKNVV
jgi:hypothetical protein